MGLVITMIPLSSLRLMRYYVGSCAGTLNVPLKSPESAFIPASEELTLNRLLTEVSNQIRHRGTEPQRKPPRMENRTTDPRSIRLDSRSSIFNPRSSIILWGSGAPRERSVLSSPPFRIPLARAAPTPLRKPRRPAHPTRIRNRARASPCPPRQR